jgi:hypothetical protein
VSNFSSKYKNKHFSRDQTGGSRVTVAIGVFVGLGLLTSGGYIATRPNTVPLVVKQDDDEIYTGSILFAPRDGKLCRQLLFDNRTGQFADAGNINCDQVYSSGAKRWSWARVQAISQGFRGH